VDATSAEVMMVELAVSMNLQMSCMDVFTKAVKRLFPDSEIAKQFQSCRSKATAFVRELAAKTSLSLGAKLKKTSLLSLNRWEH
jgi:hypothetical protein